MVGPFRTAVDPPTYYHDIQQGTPEWHSCRQGVITASGMKALITSSLKPADNETSRAYLRRLLAERIIGHAEEGVCTFKMQRGHTLEPLARDIYSEYYNPVKQCGFITRNVGGVTLGYSPDGLVDDNGLIEIKSRDPQNTLASILDPAMPAEHAIQVYTGLLVSGRKWCDYISYTPGLPLFVYSVEYDKSIAEKIVVAAIAAELRLVEMFNTYSDQACKYPMTKYIDFSPQETPWD